MDAISSSLSNGTIGRQTMKRLASRSFLAKHSDKLTNHFELPPNKISFNQLQTSPKPLHKPESRHTSPILSTKRAQAELSSNHNNVAVARETSYSKVRNVRASSTMSNKNPILETSSTCTTPNGDVACVKQEKSPSRLPHHGCLKSPSRLPHHGCLKQEKSPSRLPHHGCLKKSPSSTSSGRSSLKRRSSSPYHVRFGGVSVSNHDLSSPPLLWYEEDDKERQHQSIGDNKGIGREAWTENAKSSTKAASRIVRKADVTDWKEIKPNHTETPKSAVKKRVESSLNKASTHKVNDSCIDEKKTVKQTSKLTDKLTSGKFSASLILVLSKKQRRKRSSRPKLNVIKTVASCLSSQPPFLAGGKVSLSDTDIYLGGKLLKPHTNSKVKKLSGREKPRRKNRRSKNRVDLTPSPAISANEKIMYNSGKRLNAHKLSSRSFEELSELKKLDSSFKIGSKSNRSAGHHYSKSATSMPKTDNSKRDKAKRVRSRGKTAAEQNQEVAHNAKTKETNLKVLKRKLPKSNEVDTNKTLNNGSKVGPTNAVNIAVGNIVQERLDQPKWKSINSIDNENDENKRVQMLSNNPGMPSKHLLKELDVLEMINNDNSQYEVSCKDSLHQVDSHIEFSTSSDPDTKALEGSNQLNTSIQLRSPEKPNQKITEPVSTSTQNLTNDPTTRAKISGDITPSQSPRICFKRISPQSNELVSSTVTNDEPSQGRKNTNLNQKTAEPTSTPTSASTLHSNNDRTTTAKVITVGVRPPESPRFKRNASQSNEIVPNTVAKDEPPQWRKHITNDPKTGDANINTSRQSFAFKDAENISHSLAHNVATNKDVVFKCNPSPTKREVFPTRPTNIAPTPSPTRAAPIQKIVKPCSPKPMNGFKKNTDTLRTPMASPTVVTDRTANIVPYSVPSSPTLCRDRFSMSRSRSNAFVKSLKAASKKEAKKKRRQSSTTTNAKKQSSTTKIAKKPSSTTAKVKNTSKETKPSKTEQSCEVSIPSKPKPPSSMHSIESAIRAALEENNKNGNSNYNVESPKNSKPTSPLISTSSVTSTSKKGKEATRRLVLHQENNPNTSAHYVTHSETQHNRRRTVSLKNTSTANDISSVAKSAERNKSTIYKYPPSKVTDKIRSKMRMQPNQNVNTNMADTEEKNDRPETPNRESNDAILANGESDLKRGEKELDAAASTPKLDGQDTNGDIEATRKSSRISQSKRESRNTQDEQGHQRRGSKEKKKGGKKEKSAPAKKDKPKKNVRIETPSATDATSRNPEKSSSGSGEKKRHVISEFNGWDHGKALAPHTMTELPGSVHIADMLLQHSARQQRREKRHMDEELRKGFESTDLTPQVYLAKHCIQEQFTDFTSAILEEQPIRPNDLILTKAQGFQRQARTKLEILSQFPDLHSQQSRQRILQEVGLDPRLADAFNDADRISGETGKTSEISSALKDSRQLEQPVHFTESGAARLSTSDPSGDTTQQESKQESSSSSAREDSFGGIGLDQNGVANADSAMSWGSDTL